MTKKATITTAYVAILPETSSLDKHLRKSISDVQKTIGKNSSKIKNSAMKPVSEGIGDGAKSGSRSAVKTVSSSLGRGVSSAISGAVKKGFSGAGKVASVAGKTISKTLKGAAVTAGGGIAGVLGVSITKGVGRLQAIDQAQAKLSGLGHEADSVQAIMEDATAAVKGTAFGLDEAASAAAGTVAAGVKPGKDLQRTLKLVGDAAAIAGTDMGSMGGIFNKVATSDMMQMDVANQLMDAGIPIMQLVAKQMGVTAEEAVKMASKGEISFEIFQKAIEDGMGGAALKSGETFKGAMDNAGAAMGRFGATLADPAFQSAPSLFGALTDVFDQLNEKTKPLADRFGEELQPSVERFSKYVSEDLVDDVISGVTRTVDQFNTLRDGASSLLSLGKEKASQGYGVASSVVSTGVEKGREAVSSVLTPERVSALKETSDEAFTGMKDALSWILENGQPIFDSLMSRIEPLSEIFGTIFGGLKEIFKDKVLPLFTEGGEEGPLAKAFKAIAEAVGPITDGLNAILPPLVTILMEILRPIVGIVMDIIGLIGEIVAIVLPPLSKAIGWVMELVGKILKAIADWMVNNRPIVDALVNAFFFVRGLVSALIKGILKAGPKAIQAFKNVKSAISDAFKGIRDLPGKFRKLPGIVKTQFDKILDNIKAIWKKVEDTIKNPFENIGSWMDGLSFGSIFGGGSGGGGESFSRGGVLSGGTSRMGDDREYVSLTGHGLLSLRSGEAIMVDSFVKDLGGKSAIEKINRASRLGQPYAFSTEGFEGNNNNGSVEIKVGSDFISVSDLREIISQLSIYRQQIKIIQAGQRSSAVTSYLARK